MWKCKKKLQTETHVIIWCVQRITQTCAADSRRRNRRRAKVGIESILFRSGRDKNVCVPHHARHDERVLAVRQSSVGLGDTCEGLGGESGI